MSGSRRKRKLTRPIEEALRARLREAEENFPADLFPAELDAALNQTVGELMVRRKRASDAQP